MIENFYTSITVEPALQCISTFIDRRIGVWTHSYFLSNEINCIIDIEKSQHYNNYNNMHIV